MKDHVLDLVSDLVSDFLYYDRKEDEETPVGTIEDLVNKGGITIEEIIQRFREELKEGLSK